MLDNYKLVYSDNPNHQPTKSAKKSSPNKPVMRLEKKGRGGKSVTVVTGLARSDEELKRICKELKATCGTGGTVKAHHIEIQGDFRERIRAYFLKTGIKLAG